MILMFKLKYQTFIFLIGYLDKLGLTEWSFLTCCSVGGFVVCEAVMLPRHF